MKDVVIAGWSNLRPDQLQQVARRCRLTLTPDSALEAMRNAEILVLGQAIPVTTSLLRDLPDLRMVIAGSSTVEHIDIAACAEADVNVRWFPGYCAKAVAEHTLTCILMGLTQVLPAVDNVRRGSWDSFGFPAREFSGRMVAVIGFGATGRIVHDLCAVLGFVTRAITAETGEQERAETLSAADVITLHADINSTSRRLLGRREMDMLRDDVVIVNTAEGSLLDEFALVDFLTGNPRASALLDVCEVEPLVPDHPFRGLSNLVVTPHVAWNSEESDAYLADQVYVALMNAIDNGWTTPDGQTGVRLLTELSTDARRHDGKC